MQDVDILAKIVHDSYEPLTQKIREYSNLRFSLNINYSLVELLKNNTHQDILNNIKEAYQFRTLELTETGAYHPIFPLIPPAC